MKVTWAEEMRINNSLKVNKSEQVNVNTLPLLKVCKRCCNGASSIYYKWYTAVCKNLEPLIYISIYIYGVHCGKVFILKIVPGCKNSLTCSHRKIFLLNILNILHVYLHYTGWEVNVLVGPFPQCTRYIYILIYMKGSKFWQTAVHIYIYSFENVLSSWYISI